MSNGWGWPFPKVGEGSFLGGQLFGKNPGGEFRPNGFHNGLDFGSVDHPGSEICAVHEGTVVFAGWAPSGYEALGTVVATKSTDGYYVVYQEFGTSAGNIRVSVGQKVTLGKVIATRNTSHLHLGVTKTDWLKAQSSAFTNNGVWLDPRVVIKTATFTPSKPVPFKTNDVVRLSGGAKVASPYSNNDPIPASVVGQYYKVEQVTALKGKWDKSEYQVLISSFSNTFRKWVYEQDLTKAGGTKFKLNNRVHLSRSATVTSRYSTGKPFDPKYLADNFTVVDIAVTAEDKSPWQYRLKHKSLGDIWVLEQDLQVASKFDKFDAVQMQSFATHAGSWSSNQAIGQQYFGKTLTIVDIARIPQSNSDYQYRIRLNTNGIGDLWVLEQDLKK